MEPLEGLSGERCWELITHWELVIPNGEPETEPGAIELRKCTIDGTPRALASRQQFAQRGAQQVEAERWGYNAGMRESQRESDFHVQSVKV